MFNNINQNPNPLKTIVPLIQEKPKKVRYQSTSTFLNSRPKKKYYPNENQAERFDQISSCLNNPQE
jgi:hypothetical protein